jgi:uncharacterized damage-inducible protein DinB
MNAALPYTSFNAFLYHWRGVRLITTELLSCFEEPDLTYRLIPEWRSVGELFYHIGDHQHFVARGVLLRQWNAAPGEFHASTTVTSPARLRDWLLHTQEKVTEWSSLADDACLTDLRPDNPWHEGIRGWLLLHHAYQDELHHRGQLYAIARHLGRKPPMVFAEEHPAYWEARQGQ